jgi:hypothetical protein
MARPLRRGTRTVTCYVRITTEEDKTLQAIADAMEIPPPRPALIGLAVKEFLERRRAKAKRPK